MGELDKGNKIKATKDETNIGSETVAEPNSGSDSANTSCDIPQKPLSCTKVSSSNLESIFKFTADIVDKQYRSYIWTDGKIQTLITIDAALIAGILLIVQIFNNLSILTFGLLICSLFFLTISIIICLVHAIPRMNSGIGNEANLRTMIGISRFEKEEYHRKITELDLEEMVRMNCWQIAGMVRNNLRSHNLIKKGVLLTIFGVISAVSALITISLSSWLQTL